MNNFYLIFKIEMMFELKIHLKNKIIKKNSKFTSLLKRPSPMFSFI